MGETPGALATPGRLLRRSGGAHTPADLLMTINGKNRSIQVQKSTTSGEMRMLVKKSSKFWCSFGFPDLGRCLLLLFTAAALLLPPSPAAGDDSRPKKSVLIIFSSQSDLPAQPYVVKGIRSVLDASSEFRTEYFIEYMDLQRNSGEAFQRKLLELFETATRFFPEPRSSSPERWTMSSS